MSEFVLPTEIVERYPQRPRTRTKKKKAGRTVELLGIPKASGPIYERLGFTSWNNDGYIRVRDIVIRMLKDIPYPFAIDTAWSSVSYNQRLALVQKIAPVFANTADPEDMALAMIITLTSNQRREQRRGFKGPGGTRGRPRIHPVTVTIDESDHEDDEYEADEAEPEAEPTISQYPAVYADNFSPVSSPTPPVRIPATDRPARPPVNHNARTSRQAAPSRTSNKNPPKQPPREPKDIPSTQPAPRTVAPARKDAQTRASGKIPSTQPAPRTAGRSATTVPASQPMLHKVARASSGIASSTQGVPRTAARSSAAHIPRDVCPRGACELEAVRERVCVEAIVAEEARLGTSLRAGATV